jgi:hypothetical protein
MSGARFIGRELDALSAQIDRGHLASTMTQFAADPQSYLAIALALRLAELL